jgi:diadenylate cyclase
VGLSKECDAIVVVVSEETGSIRLAERGQLSEALAVDQLKEQLEKRLTRTARGLPVAHAEHAAPREPEPPPLTEANQETVHGEAVRHER